MRNKILKLVLNKNCSKKSIILNKKDGNITSLISGLMFLILVIILIMFNFRVNMLSEVFYNIDDALTASTLGAATPNTDAYMHSYLRDELGNVINEYPEQGQIVLQDTTLDSSSLVSYKQGEMHDGKYWNEQVVVVSELNSNLINNGRYDAGSVSDVSNIYTSPSSNDKRIGYSNEYTSSSEFENYTNFKINNRTITNNDNFALQSINTLLNLTYTNLTQSLSAPKVISLKNVADNFCIKKDSVLDYTFLGDYLSSDINLTRLEMYNLYRYTLAERHVYASPYMTYTVAIDGIPLGNNYTWDGYNMDGTPSSATPIILSKPIILENGTEITETNEVRYMINNTAMGSYGKTTGIDITVSGFLSRISNSDEEAFKDLMQELYPAMVIPGREPDWFDTENADESDYDMYNLMKTLWKVDLEAWNNRDNYPLIFWEDTGITCQTSWWDYTKSDGNTYVNELNKYYGYLWNNSSQNVIKIDNNILVTDTQDRLLLPIEGCSTYLYVVGKSSTLGQYNNFSVEGSILLNKVASVKLGDANPDGTNISSIDDDTLDNSFGNIYKKRKTADTDLYYSGIYMEVVFDVATFPVNNSNNSLWNLGDFGTQTATQSRLVTITKKD